MDFNALIKIYLQKGLQLTFLSVVTATSLMAEIKWQFVEMIYTKVKKCAKGSRFIFCFAMYLLITTYVVASFLAQFCKRLGYISHFIFPSVIIYHDIQPWKRSIVNDNGCSVIKIALAYVVVIWLKGKLWWWWWKKPPTSLPSSFL